MVNIQIVAEGLEQNKSFLNNLINNHDEELNQLLVKIGEQIIDEARFILSQNNHIDTGGLMGSIKVMEVGDKYIVVGSDAPHAGYIEFGRGPIRPTKEGGVLRFFDKKSGKMVFTTYSAPTEPSPFLQPAVEKQLSTFQGLYSEMVETRFL